MGNLIRDNQEERANNSKPDLSNLPKPTQAPSQPEQGASSAAEPQLPPPSVNQGEEEFAPFLEEPIADPSTAEPVAVPPPPAPPATPGANAPIVPELPNLFTDVVSEQQLSPYAPEVINTKIPTVYATTPDLSGTSRARKITGDLIKFQEMEEKQRQQAEAASQRPPAIQQTPNTTNVDKPWYRTGALGFLNDVLFGNEQARAATEQGRFNPFVGEFGRQGAGLGGALKYTLGLTSNLPVGAISDLYQGLNVFEEKTGINPDDIAKLNPGVNVAKTGLDLIFGNRQGDDSVPSIFKYNPDAAKKQGSAVVGALAGNDIADVGDPLASTNTGTGRVFYNPRRATGAPVWKDPLGLGAEIALNLVNPIDNLNPVANAIGSVIGYGVRAVVRKGNPVAKASETSGALARVGQESSELANFRGEELYPRPIIGLPGAAAEQAQEVRRLPTANRLPPTEVVDAEIVFENPYALAAGQPVQVPRVYLGSSEVVQKRLPPAIDPKLLPPANARVVLPEVAPSKYVFDIGFGRPSASAVEPPGALVVRPHSQIVEQLRQTDPKLVENYTGQTVEELAEHVGKVDPKLEPTQFNTVVSKPAQAQITPEALKESEEFGMRLQFNQEMYVDDLIDAGVDNPGVMSIGARINDMSLALQTGDNERILRNLNDTGGLLDYVDEPITESLRKISDIIPLGDIVKQRDSLLAAAIDNLDLSKVNPENIKPFAKYEVTPPEKLPPFVKEFNDKIGATWNGKKWTMTPEAKASVSQVVQSIQPNLDDLISASRELAGHKVIIGETLSKLDDLFETTVDFGRKFVDSIEPRVTTVDDILNTVANGGKPNLLREAYANQSRLVRETIESNDWAGLQSILQKTGQDPTQFISDMVATHNRILTEPVQIANINPKRGRTFDVPKSLYHGSALADWQPGYNVRLRGSRGELGYGQYYTVDPKASEQYALARVGENVNPETLERPLSPAVNEVSHKFVSTLDANAKLPSTSDFFKDLTVGLPSELQKLVRRALGRTKNNTYNSLLTKVESNMVKAGLEPTEETLTSVQRIISDNLRILGYDSVIDKKSGFLLGLTSEGVTKTGARELPAADAMTAVTARYNADAYAAKYYPSRLTTNANLQDSTYKLYSQLHDKIDNKLADVQQELTNRLSSEVDGVMPKVEIYPASSVKQPKTVEDVIAEVNSLADDICGA